MIVYFKKISEYKYKNKNTKIVDKLKLVIIYWYDQNITKTQEYRQKRKTVLESLA